MNWGFNSMAATLKGGMLGVAAAAKLKGRSSKVKRLIRKLSLGLVFIPLHP